MDNCTKSRRSLIEWGALESLAPMLLMGSDGFPNDGSEQGQQAVEHLQSCKKCQYWAKEFTTTDNMARMERLSQYCCPQMFVAVEESNQADIHLQFRQFRDEYLWMVDQKDREFGFEFFSFCPWCGNKLPETPFIDDVLGRG